MRRDHVMTETKAEDREKIYNWRMKENKPFSWIGNQFTPRISRQRAKQQFDKYVKGMAQTVASEPAILVPSTAPPA